MTQGANNANFFSGSVTIGDGPNLDAFSRLRISNPDTLWDVQSQYNTNSLTMESGNTGTGTSAPTHDANTRMIALSTTAGTGTVYTQSYEYIPYQPGKSHFIAITGLLGAGVAGAVVDVGYFDASNGIFLRQNGTSGLQLVRRTKTSGSVVDNTVAQTSWNIDTLDGNGGTGITLDVTKVFILVIDLQFLGMGRIRVGFDIGGKIVYVHEFVNANVLTVPYMQTASLPIQMLITTTATGGAKASYFKCAAVESEGGRIDHDSFPFSTPEAVETAGSGTRTHILSVRPKTTFNSIANRERFVIGNLDILVTGSNPVYWELCVGAVFAASTWADVNTAYSAFEYTSVRGSFTNLTTGIVIASGHVSGAGSGANPPTVTPITINSVVAQKYPISLDRAGAVRAMGTLTLLVTGIGGTSASRAVINFMEIR
jgi:hypothetical protein